MGGGGCVVILAMRGTSSPRPGRTGSPRLVGSGGGSSAPCCPSLAPAAPREAGVSLAPNLGGPGEVGAPAGRLPAGVSEVHAVVLVLDGRLVQRFRQLFVHLWHNNQL